MNDNEREFVYVVCSHDRKINEYLDPGFPKCVEGVFKNLKDAKAKIIEWIKHEDVYAWDAEIAVHDINTGERVDVIYFKHFWSDEVKDVYGKAVSV